MRLTLPQKVSALVRGWRYRQELRHLLVRRFWQQHESFDVNIDGLRASFDTSDFYSNFSFYMTEHEEVEPPVARMIAQAAPTARSFFDIGANLGYFSVIAGLAAPSLRIDALEMDRSIYPMLRRNLERNGVKGVTLHEGAVGETAGTLRFQPHLYSFLAKCAPEDAVVPELEIDVPIIRIDDVIAKLPKPPDLVKMDVDGAEVDALRAADTMLSTPDLVMFLELHSPLLEARGQSLGDVWEILARHGLASYQITDHRSHGGGLRKLESFNGLPTNDMVLVTRRDPAEIWP
ncbi:MAG: FkbM family methyltransferase [Pseudomonadota bacterium]